MLSGFTIKIECNRRALAYMFLQVCMICGQTCDDLSVANCKVDGGVLDVRYDSVEVPLQPQLTGIRRYAAHLPLTDPEIYRQPG